MNSIQKQGAVRIMTCSDWGRAENILCIRLDTIGDVLMTAPAIRALKGSRSKRRVTLLTSSAGTGIARLVPVIDRVITYDAPWMKNPCASGQSRTEYALAAALRRERFDAAAIFSVYSQNPLPSAFLCYLSDIPLRLAYCRENPYQLLTHWVPDPEPSKYIRHEVRRQLDLVETVGCRAHDESIPLYIPDRSRERVRTLLRSLRIVSGQPWVIIHPGATAHSRRYPAENFAAVADYLSGEIGFRVIFTGTAEEHVLLEKIRAMMRASSYSLAGRLTIGEFSALIELAPLIISNNTGPVHIAAALGTRVVDLYALTNPQHTPWMVPSRVLSHDVPCRYCYKSVCPERHNNCLRLISPGEVIRAAVELLSSDETQKPDKGKNAYVYTGNKCRLP